MYTNVIISKQFIEVKRQSIPPLIPRTQRGGRKKNFNATEDSCNELNHRVSVNRARKNIRRLLECNFSFGYSFLTLTFNQDTTHDITDYSQCYKAFCDFKKRLSYYLKTMELPVFKYIGVTEFQDQRNGAIHYHLVCNLNTVNRLKVEELWGNGWVNLQQVVASPTDNEKISSYMKKGISDPRLNKRKKYFRSQHLEKPIYIDLTEDQEKLDQLINSNTLKLSEESYQSPIYGAVNLATYYINNFDGVKIHAKNATRPIS
ncbi:hypothetical protein M662_03325 [Bacillus sp. SB49]|uniref:rolling circle replication-associated protein n=1 Tax=Bacillus sp. SB49 TaxID=1071080 RepID=UPI0004047FD4|nr:hypothetical protein [Bacillus sp. SB49]QHT45581.1 hypothetical protein M662_03325 [Bacillus sp. SB49]